MLLRSALPGILEDIRFFPVVAIIGPRQVGKTTLAKYVQRQTHCIYLDLELSTDRQKLSDAETYLTYHQDKCVVIDEAQRMPELFALLRALVDQNRRPGRFILLGSASPAILKEASETLAGRIAYHELTPFSWLEAADIVTVDHHWLRGGFPQAMLAAKAAQAQRWLRFFLETFVQRDLRDIGHQVTPALVTRLLEMVATLNGQVLNQSDLARSLGVSPPTVNRYLDLLEGGFVIQRLPPYFANVTKRLTKQPKIYIRDSGLLHHLLGIYQREQLLGNAAVGASWEGYVIEQIKRVDAGESRLYFYRTHKGAESDLVLVTAAGKKYCIEIKRSAAAKISRGFYETIADIQPEKSFVIVPETEHFPKNEAVWMSSLDHFLRHDLPEIKS